MTTNAQVPLDFEEHLMQIQKNNGFQTDFPLRIIDSQSGENLETRFDKTSEIKGFSPDVSHKFDQNLSFHNKTQKI